MNSFFKLYWPIFISELLFFIIGILIGTRFYGDAVFVDGSNGLLLVLLTLSLVISVYAVMIYFMIKVFKDERIKNKVLWCFGLYLFNVFIFPYFNLKYLCNEKDIKNKIFIFGFISILVFLIGLYIPRSYVSESFEPLTIIEDDVSVRVGSGYREVEIGEYDFYLKDTRRQINIGGFVYDEDDSDTPDIILKSRDTWIKTSRDNVTHLDSITKETDDSLINLNIYIGSNNGIKNMYYISTIEFKNTNCFVNVISTYLYDDYLDYKEELIKVLEDMEYIQD